MKKCNKCKGVGQIKVQSPFYGDHGFYWTMCVKCWGKGVK